MDPLVPEHVDLRDFAYMPLDVVRLRDSDLAALSSGEEFRAAVMLWCACWHQAPAASLPNDDRLLARLAGFGRDVSSWLDVKEGALRGFIECSDGRLYHRVIAEKALEAWEQKQKQRAKTAAATAARRRGRNENDDGNPDGPGDGQRDEHRDDNRDDARDVHQGKGREEKGKSPPVVPPQGDEAQTFFDEFWSAYPSRGDAANPKKPAKEKFLRLLKAGTDPKAMIAGARAYAEVCRKAGKLGTELVMQATRFLNQAVWEQYQSTSESPAGSDPDFEWRVLLEAFAKHGVWPSHYGPQPGEPGCRAPDGLIRKILIKEVA